MKKILFAFLAMTLLTGPARANEQQEVAAAFASWRAALSSGKAENIVRLYDKDAILLATLAEKPLTTQQQRLEYFTKLAALPEIAASVTAEYIRVLDEDSAVISGLYYFSFKKDGESVVIPARYSFVYEKRDGAWIIIEHHSSKVPPPQ